MPLIPTGVEGIGVYGRTPLTPELRAIMPADLMSGVVIAVDRKGSRLLIAAFDPRRPADEAARAIAPDVQLDPVPPYVMVSCSVTPDTVVPPSREWTDETPAADARVDAARGRGLAPDGRRAGRRDGARLDLHDPVRLPHPGRVLEAVAG